MRWKHVVAGVVVTVAAIAAAPSTVGARRDGGTVNVVVRGVEPFVIQDVNGDLRGFSVDLAREIAHDAGYTVAFTVVSTVTQQLDAVKNGTADAAIGAITITSAREDIVDFSQPTFESGIQIAVADRSQSLSAGMIADQVFTRFLLGILILMVVGTLLTGLAIWLLERRRNPDFAGGGWRGAFEGVWWATVTLFTIGYGDKVPKRGLSRLIAMVWMFAGVLMVATLTAEVTANLTVDRIDGDISSITQLYDKHVVTITDSTSADLLKRNGVGFTTVDDPGEAILMVEKREVDAFVYDAAVLQYLASRNPGVRVTGPIVQFESYGIAFAPGSPLRKPVNRALLQLREDGTYKRLFDTYFG